MKKFFATLLSATMLCSSASAADFAVGAFFSSNADVNLQLYRSDDMIHMDHLLSRADIAGRDPSIRYRNGTCYICFVDPAQTFKILSTADFETWTTQSFNVIERDEKYPAIWAPDLFIDDDGAAYVYFAKQKPSKDREKLFDIYVSRASSIEKFDFEPAQKISLADYESIIDAHVHKIGGQYYMIVKDEKIHTNNDNKSPHLFRSTAPDKNFVEVADWDMRAVRGYEGFSIAADGDKIYIYADNYSGKYDAAPPSHHTVWITDDIERGPFRAEYVESVRPMRHGSVIMINDAELNKLLGTMPVERATADIPTRTITLEREDYGTGKGHAIEIDEFAPAPKVIYRLPKKTRLQIKSIVNAYGVDRIEFELSEGTSIDINGVLKRENEGSSVKRVILQSSDGIWNIVPK